MKIKIELDTSLDEEEIILRYRELSPLLLSLQEMILDKISSKKQLLLSKDGTEYFLDLEDILFFEITDSQVNAHTKKQSYPSTYCLYELEDLLPGNFMRISKSCILNTDLVFSITRDLTASSTISFKDTHKQVFVSRHYYKPLKFKLEEKRTYHETK